MLQSWNWATSVSGSTVSGVASQSWEALPAYAASTVTVGGSFTSSSQDFHPSLATLNGQACTIK